MTKISPVVLADSHISQLVQRIRDTEFNEVLRVSGNDIRYLPYIASRYPIAVRPIGGGVYACHLYRNGSLLIGMATTWELTERDRREHALIRALAELAERRRRPLGWLTQADSRYIPAANHLSELGLVTLYEAIQRGRGRYVPIRLQPVSLFFPQRPLPCPPLFPV